MILPEEIPHLSSIFTWEKPGNPVGFVFSVHSIFINTRFSLEIVSMSRHPAIPRMQPIGIATHSCTRYSGSRAWSRCGFLHAYRESSGACLHSRLLRHHPWADFRSPCVPVPPSDHRRRVASLPQGTVFLMGGLRERNGV